MSNKITSENVENVLNILEEIYSLSIEIYLAEIFNEYILPVLKEKELKFISGNGTYWVDGVDAFNEEFLPKEFKDILEIPIPRFNQSAGSFMPTYTGEKKDD